MKPEKSESTIAMPEKPILLERLINKLPFSYHFGSLLLALLVGPPGFLLFEYFDTFSLDRGVIAFFHGYEPAQPWQKTAAILLWTAVNFYAFIAIRYVRLNIVRVKSKLEELIPQNASRRNKFFSNISDVAPAFLVSLLLAGFFYTDILNAFQSPDGAIGFIYRAITVPIQYFSYGTALWVYFSSLLGLYRMGRQKLNLKPFHLDLMLGTLPLGNLSLSISNSYFVLIALFVVNAFIAPSIPQFMLALIILTILGVLMFFLPLYGVHRQMLETKMHEQESFSQKLIQSIKPSDKKSKETNEIHQALMELKQVQAMQVLQHYVDNIPTWPFDTEIISRLAAVVIPITIGITTRLLAVLLNI